VLGEDGADRGDAGHHFAQRNQRQEGPPGRHGGRSEGRPVRSRHGTGVLRRTARGGAGVLKRSGRREARLVNGRLRSRRFSRTIRTPREPIMQRQRAIAIAARKQEALQSRLLIAAALLLLPALLLLLISP